MSELWDAEELALKAQIRALQKLHREELEPLFKRLVEIEMRRPPPPWVTTIEEARRLGIVVTAAPDQCSEQSNACDQEEGA